MLAEVRTGMVFSAAGTVQPARSDKTGALVTTEGHGRYTEAVLQGRVFTAYCTAQALSTAAAGMVGLQLWNATLGQTGGGGYNLVLLKAGGFIFVTSATTTGIVLAVGTGQTAAPTGQTAATKVTNNLVGGLAPGGLALAAGTFTAAPAAILNLMHNTAAIGTTGEDTGFSVDLEGSIVIPPGAFVAFAALGASAAASSTNLHLMWEEVPV